MGRVDFASVAVARRVGEAFETLLADWRQARAVRRTMRDLQALDDRTLADIGLERAGIEAAARRAVGRL
ncbi:MAG: DUF1127 domain-containing protein [Pseudomonadota bacterium]